MKVLRAAAVAALLGVCACQGQAARPAPNTGSASAGAGAGAKDADRLLAAAAENGRSAGSVTAGFRIAAMGQLATGTVSVDASGHCTGTIESTKLGRMSFLTDGTRAWLKADERVWGPRVAAMVKNRHVTGPASAAPFSSFGPLSCRAAAAPITGDIDTAVTTARSSTAANGVRTAALTDSDGSTLEITAGEHPFIARTAFGSNGEQRTWVFRHYGWPVDFTPPPAAATIDLAAVLLPDTAR
ncbi:hypothetical protein [Kitasatospora sp. DSM 101779]|uniref:hypothetical protein n=1 Tax=Kitasatospora sp. DSM 101779 TaxID=2853165 RepID=UPI0021DADFA1|nr:hypothetical protein [Kitasatospora sp. DSM 101779]MCU7824226.1 hypothetical protein [Kitasatospora sp. DSM 101779]